MGRGGSLGGVVFDFFLADFSSCCWVGVRRGVCGSSNEGM